MPGVSYFSYTAYVSRRRERGIGMNGLFRGEVQGSATVGARGQVVIPSEVRASLGIRPGDRLIVFVRSDRRTLGLMRARDFTRMLAQASRIISKFKRKASRKGA